MNRIRAILIDDEMNNLLLLQRMIQKHCPEIDVIAIEDDAEKGIGLVQKWQPNLIFLDIEMPQLDGFEFLKRIDSANMEIIFVTAHAEFALQAFDVHAIGYITKPIQPKKLIQTVQHACEKVLNQHFRGNLYTQIAEQIYHRQEEKMPLPTLNGLVFISPEEIIYCESKGSYTYFHLLDGNKIMVSKPLGSYERQLPEQTFIRIHDSFIINIRFVTTYVKGRGGEVTLGKLATLPVSANRKDILLARFDKWLKK